MQDTTFRLRPMGIGDLLDETIRVYRRNFRLLAGIVATVTFPAALLQVLAEAALPGGDGPSAGNLLQISTAAAVAGIVVVLAYLARFLATTYAVSEVYLGRRPTIGSAYEGGTRRLPAAVLLSILAALAIGLMAVTILGIPFAIYFGVSWTVAIQAMLLEGLGPRRALGRSRFLVRGHWWRVLGTGILLSLLVLIISMALYLPIGILQGILLLGGSSTVGFGLATVITALLGAAVQTVTEPIRDCGLVLLYYDLRVRKEGFDLELLARGLDGQAGTS